MWTASTCFLENFRLGLGVTITGQSSGWRRDTAIEIFLRFCLHVVISHSLCPSTKRLSSPYSWVYILSCSGFLNPAHTSSKSLWISFFGWAICLLPTLRQCFRTSLWTWNIHTIKCVCKEYWQMCTTTYLMPPSRQISHKLVSFLTHRGLRCVLELHMKVPIVSTIFCLHQFKKMFLRCIQCFLLLSSIHCLTL